MSRLRTVLRAAVATLPALVLCVPGTAHAAASTWAIDDGTAESSIHMSHPQDSLSKRIDLPDGAVSGASSAAVWLYGRAGDCHGSGPTERLYNAPAYILADFDPCAVFPTAAFGWAAIPVPLNRLYENLSNSIRVYHVGAPTDRTADYGTDTDTDRHASFANDGDTGTYGFIAGELMFRYVFNGNAASFAVSPKSVDLGLTPPGTGVTRTVTVTSSGTANATVTGLAFSGAAAADYAVVADGCTGVALAPQATCTFGVRLTPSTIGTRAATLTVTGTGGVKRTVSLTGEGRSAPPASTITSPANGVALTGTDVTGTVTDDLAVAYEYVTFTPLLPALPLVTSAATLACDAARRSCTWSVPNYLLPGPYTVSAHAVDSQGIAEAPGPSVSVLVV